MELIAMYSFFIWLAIIGGLLLCFFLLRYIIKNIHKSPVDADPVVNDVEPIGHSLAAKDSLLLIASSLLDGQVEVAEASIRLKVLLDHYDPSLHQDPVFSVFNTLYDGLAHMPTHQARKQTDKKFLHKMDQERLALEAKYRSNALQAAEALVQKLNSDS